jgi:hypothetical protein
LNTKTRVFYIKWHFAEQNSRLEKLSPDARLAYMDIFNRDGMGWHLPADHNRLAATLGYPLEAITELLTKFDWLFTAIDGRLHHTEVNEARDKADQISAKRSAAGKRGMESRWADNICYNKPDNKPVYDDVGVSSVKAPNGLKPKSANLENTLTSENTAGKPS